MKAIHHTMLIAGCLIAAATPVLADDASKETIGRDRSGVMVFGVTHKRFRSRQKVP